MPRVGRTGEVELRGADAHDRWSLVAAATRATVGPADGGTPEASPAGSASRAAWRDGLQAESARARLGFDWLRAGRAGELHAGAFATRTFLGIHSGGPGDAASALDERLEHRREHTRIGAELGARASGGAAGLAWRHTLGLRIEDDSLDAREVLGNAFQGAQSTLLRDGLQQVRTSLQATEEIRLGSRLRLNASITAQRFRVRAGGATAGASEAFDGSRLAPAAGATLALGSGQLFANFSAGAADGGLALVDPRSAAPLPVLDPALDRRFGEVGWRGALPGGVDARVSAWRAASSSEITLTGTDGWRESPRPSLREGVRLALRYEPARWIALDLDATWSKARFGDGAREAVAAAAGAYATAGATVRPARGWSASLSVNYLGPRPGVDEDSLRLRSSTLVNAQVSHKLSKTTRVTFDVFNVFDHRIGEVDQFALARVATAPGATENYLFHPAEPRGFRIGFRKTF